MLKVFLLLTCLLHCNLTSGTPVKTDVTRLRAGCPDYPPDELVRCAGWASVDCELDSDCGDSQICCRTACQGYSCFKQEAPSETEVIVSECPKIDRAVISCLADEEAWQDACSDDSECKSGTHCCEQACTGKRCVNTDEIILPMPIPEPLPFPLPPPVKKGECPPVLENVFGICIEQCSDDYGCDGSMKCCSNGCGHTCVEPFVEVVKSGDCPPHNPFLKCMSPPDACLLDSACPGDEKCCRVDCRGRQCVKPIINIKSECPKIDRTVVLCMADEEAWQDACSDDSECKTGTHCCEQACTGKRCVNIDGPIEPIPLPVPQPMPVEVKKGRCPALKDNVFGICVQACSDDYSCSGTMKCCSNGCGHTCMEPELDDVVGSCPAVDENIRCFRQDDVRCGEDDILPSCLQNQICCPTSCGGTMCTDIKTPPPPPPVIFKEGLCPPALLGSVGGICLEECFDDSGCFGSMKCCSNGCGHTCTEPVSLDVKKPGSCPANQQSDVQIITICLAQCSGDNSCPGAQKCCSFGCMTSCVEPDVVKEGTCPARRRPVFSHRCPRRRVRACSRDADCRGKAKCCDDGCGGLACRRPSRPKRGICPQVPFKKCVTNYSLKCESDNDCRGLDKCCETPCNGSMCRRPVKRNKVPKVKVGSCPAFDPRLVRCAAPPEDGCSADGNCPGNQKCCLSCLGLQCTEPQ